ncbi:hypothetical protein HHK36_013454 [Tetracentron sinense]|uniref:DUF4283 domain-containing protein n=2 Tax=Magnoliopsida TaxID=3398 RepID=A0A835DDC6_TETSI|nr:hypothetical protein HHK36_013454 [Tetracentron sinense]
MDLILHLSIQEIMLEFRAGKMFTEGTRVIPDKRKGLVRISRDQIVFPDEAVFEKINQSSERVYILKFNTDDRKLFFWMQEPKPDGDSQLCTSVNFYINQPLELVGEEEPEASVPLQMSELSEDIFEDEISSRFAVEAKVFELLEVSSKEGCWLKFSEFSKRGRRSSLWLPVGAIPWMANLVSECLVTKGYCFKKYGEKGKSILGEKRSNFRGEFLVFQTFLNSGNGGRLCVPRGGKNVGWRALLVALSAFKAPASLNRLDGLQQPVAPNYSGGTHQVGSIPAPRWGLRSHVEAAHGASRIVVDLDAGVFHHWAEAVVCTLSKAGSHSTWVEVVHLLQHLVPLESKVTLFPFESCRAIFHPKQGSSVFRICNNQSFHLGCGIEVGFHRWWPASNALSYTGLSQTRWIALKGIPFHLWVPSVFSQIGQICGTLVAVHPSTQKLEDLAAAKIQVQGDLRLIPRIIAINFHSISYPIEISIWDVEACDFGKVQSESPESGQRSGLVREEFSAGEPRGMDWVEDDPNLAHHSPTRLSSPISSSAEPRSAGGKLEVAFAAKAAPKVGPPLSQRLKGKGVQCPGEAFHKKNFNSNLNQKAVANCTWRHRRRSVRRKAWSSQRPPADLSGRDKAEKAQTNLQNPDPLFKKPGSSVAPNSSSSGVFRLSLPRTPVWPEQGKGNPLDGKISSSQRHLAKIDQIPRGGVEVFRFADEINRFQHSPVHKEAESHFKKLGPTGGGRDTQMQETEKSGGEVPIRRIGAEKVRSRFRQVYCRRARLHVRGSSEVGLQRVRFGPRVNSIVIKPSPPHIEEHADDHIGSSNSIGEFRLLRRSGSVDSLISSPDPLANIRHNSSGHAEEGSACNGGVNGDGLPGPDGGSEQGAPLKGSLELAQEVSRVKDSVEVKPTLSPGVEDSVDDRVNWSSASDNSYDGSSDEEGLWRMQVAEPEVEKESSEEVDSRSIGSIAQEAEEGQLTRRVCLANVARSVEVSKLLGLQFPGGAEQAGLGRGERRLDVRGLLRKIKPDLIALAGNLVGPNLGSEVTSNITSSSGPVQLADLQRILSNIGPADAAGDLDGGLGLGDILKPDLILPLIETLPLEQRLASYLPEGQWTAEDLMELLQSPPFRQQVEAFTYVLRTGQIDLSQFGIDPSKCKHFFKSRVLRDKFTVLSFLEALDDSVAKASETDEVRSQDCSGKDAMDEGQ